MSKEPRQEDLDEAVSRLLPAHRRIVAKMEGTPLDVRNTARLYRQQVIESQPGANPLHPVQVRRELKSLGVAAKNLRERLENLSPEAQNWISWGSLNSDSLVQDSMERAHAEQWFCIPFAVPTGENTFRTLKPDILNLRRFELMWLEHFLKWAPKPKPSINPEECLVCMVAIGVKWHGGRKAHVLPIAQTIHVWAAQVKQVSPDWGQRRLDAAWDNPWG